MAASRFLSGAVYSSISTPSGILKKTRKTRKTTKNSFSQTPIRSKLRVENLQALHYWRGERRKWTDEYNKFISENPQIISPRVYSSHREWPSFALHQKGIRYQDLRRRAQATEAFVKVDVLAEWASLYEVKGQPPTAITTARYNNRIELPIDTTQPGNWAYDPYDLSTGVVRSVSKSPFKSVSAPINDNIVLVNARVLDEAFAGARMMHHLILPGLAFLGSIGLVYLWKEGSPVIEKFIWKIFKK